MAKENVLSVQSCVVHVYAELILLQAKDYFVSG
jgi:hypothetical protein